MTYEKAVNALVKAGLLDNAAASVAGALLTAPSVERTYPAWAQALAQARYGANAERVATVMEKPGIQKPLPRRKR